MILGAGNFWESMRRIKQDPVKGITESIINEPSIGAGAVIGGGSKVITKNITKQGLKILPLAVGAAGGILAGRFLGGSGGSQKTDQTSKQKQDTTATQTSRTTTLTFAPQTTTTNIADYSTTTQKTVFKIQDSPFSSISGSAGISPLDYIGNPNQTIPTITTPYQGVDPTQTTDQTADQGQISLGSDMIIIAAALLGGAWLLTRKR